jgi:hypothetical protein
MRARSEWRAAAACRSTPPETFFPTAEAGEFYEAQVAVAKAVCAGCSVRAACLSEALARIPFGIAGGLTPEERRTLGPQRSGVESDAVLAAGLAPGAARAEVAAAGRTLLATGRTTREVARRCGVSERTVARRAAGVSADVTGSRRGAA